MNIDYAREADISESEGMIRELACKVFNADAQTQDDILNKVLARANGESVTSAMVDMEVHFWKHGTYPLTEAEKLELKRIELEVREGKLNEREYHIQDERKAMEEEWESEMEEEREAMEEEWEAIEGARHEAEIAMDDADELKEELREELKAEMKAEMMAAFIETYAAMFLIK